MPSGAKSLPSTPDKAKSGKKTRITTAVPKTMALRISLLASYTTKIADLGFPAALFSFRRRKIFSTSTMASSTSSPIATAIPPKVITLIESCAPVTWLSTRNTSVVMTSDSGIAVRVMKVVRKFIKNRNRMMSTSTAPMTSASPTLKMPRSIKFLSRNRSELITMSAGSEDSTLANAAAMSSVKARVSTWGCFTTVKTAPGRPLMLPSPRLNAAPSATRATSSSSTGRRSLSFTGTLRRSCTT